jgi:hypothetical protein
MDQIVQALESRPGRIETEPLRDLAAVQNDWDRVDAVHGSTSFSRNRRDNQAPPPQTD